MRLEQMKPLWHSSRFNLACFVSSGRQSNTPPICSSLAIFAWSVVLLPAHVHRSVIYLDHGASAAVATYTLSACWFWAISSWPTMSHTTTAVNGKLTSQQPRDKLGGQWTATMFHLWVKIASHLALFDICCQISHQQVIKSILCN